MNIPGLTAVTQTIEGIATAGYEINTSEDVNLNATTFTEHVVNVFNIVTTGKVTIIGDGKQIRIGNIKAEGLIIISGDETSKTDVFGNIYSKQSIIAQHVRQVNNKLFGAMNKIRIEYSQVASVAADKEVILENVEQHDNSKVQVIDGDFFAVRSQLGREVEVSRHIRLENVRQPSSAQLRCHGDFIASDSELGNVIEVAGRITLQSVKQDPQGKISSETGSVLVQAESRVGRVFAGDKVKIDKNSHFTAAHANLNRVIFDGQQRNIFRRIFSFFTGK